MKLDSLTLFLKIVEKGSLVGAGRELGLSATTVSERLAALEAHYGVTLINRTTRAIRLTEEGRTLLEGARQVLDNVEELNNRIRLGAQTLSGRIRVSAPIDLGRVMIKPIVDEFLAANPKTSIDLKLSDGYVNIIDEGIDIAIRFGDLGDSTLRARRLGENQRIVCAAPAYLQQYGVPETPADLQQHNCLLMRFGTHLDNVWRFRMGDRDELVAVSGNRVANDSGLTHDWCSAGHGIMLKSIWDVGAELESGALVRLLGEYAAPSTYIHMLFPPARSQPQRARAFANKLSDVFAQKEARLRAGGYFN